MTLKFLDRPQVWYTEKSPYEEDWTARFPRNSAPIATAPERGGGAVIVYEPSGEGHYAMFYRGQWQKLEAQRDAGDVLRWRMTGSAVTNPVRWSSS